MDAVLHHFVFGSMFWVFSYVKKLLFATIHNTQRTGASLR